MKKAPSSNSVARTSMPRYAPEGLGECARHLAIIQLV